MVKRKNEKSEGRELRKTSAGGVREGQSGPLIPSLPHPLSKENKKGKRGTNSGETAEAKSGAGSYTLRDSKKALKGLL